MKYLTISQMEKECYGSAFGCALGVVSTMGAFIGLGACTLGAGWAALAILGYGSSLYSLVSECSDMPKIQQSGGR